jgi:hypothetical protein
LKPRGAWGPAEYAAATGRDWETAEVLKARVANGGLSLVKAREIMSAQGFDPDMIGKVGK